MIVPARVMSEPLTRARPKSMILTRPLVCTGMFAGFRARCTSCIECANASPSRHCSISPSLSPTVSRRASLMRLQAGDQEIREALRGLVGACGAFRVVPARDPVARAQDRERVELGVAGAKRALADAGLDHRPHAAVEAVALRHHLLEVGLRQRL